MGEPQAIQVERTLNEEIKSILGSNSFRSGQNRYPTGNRPIFVGSRVGSVLEHGQIGSGQSCFSQVSEKSRLGTRASEDRPGFY